MLLIVTKIHNLVLIKETSDNSTSRGIPQKSVSWEMGEALFHIEGD